MLRRKPNTAFVDRKCGTGRIALFGRCLDDDRGIGRGGCCERAKRCLLLRRWPTLAGFAKIAKTNPNDCNQQQDNREPNDPAHWPVISFALADVAWS